MGLLDDFLRQGRPAQELSLSPGALDRTPIADFLSAEAGQRRRAWLDQQTNRAAGVLDYYLGPQLGQTVNNALQVGAMVSPGQDVADATQAGRNLMDWNGPLDAAGDAATMTAALGSMLMPGGVSSYRQGIDSLAGELAGSYDPNTLNAFTVWHGSPHTFDRFDSSRIGTGEGAQAYGHGLYFAENADTARAYRDNLAGRGSVMSGAVDGLPDRWQMEVFDVLSKPNGPIRAQAITDLRARVPSEYADQVDAALNANGSLYEVSIDAEPEDFLDWDAPLSEQPEVLRRIGADTVKHEDLVEAAARARVGSLEELMSMTGAEYYRAVQNLGGQANATRELSVGMRSFPTRDGGWNTDPIGLPGIRYLDQGSRDGGQGTRNYVLFDDALAEIITRNGQPVRGLLDTVR